jgi:hypothetical protein
MCWGDENPSWACVLMLHNMPGAYLDFQAVNLNFSDKFWESASGVLLRRRALYVIHKNPFPRSVRLRYLRQGAARVTAGYFYETRRLE